MLSNLNWDFLFELDPNSGIAVWKLIGEGLLNTLKLVAVAWILSIVCGTVVGTLRTSSFKLIARLGDAYTELFRNIPLLVQLFLWFFVLPVVVPTLKTVPYTTYQFFSAVLALGLFSSARISEQVRAGIYALPRGQRYAAQAIGLTQFQTYRHVLLPQALRLCLPPMTNETMSLIKNSTVALTIGYGELMFKSVKEVAEFNFRFFEVYAVVTVIYIVLALLAGRALVYVEQKTVLPGYVTSK